MDANSSRSRGEGDDLNPQLQIEGGWQRPHDTTRAEPDIHLGDDESFFDTDRRLESKKEYIVRGPDGEIRTRVYTDKNGIVTHVDAIAPNRLNANNPEVARPHPNSDYRVQVGRRSDVYPTGPDGEPRFVTHNGVSRVDHVQKPPKPHDIVTVDENHHLAPEGNEAFSRTGKESLQPNTRYHVVDKEGNSRGTFQTDENRDIKWIDTDYNDGNSVELADRLPNANYRVDRGPLYEEYHVDENGRPEPAAPWNPPDTGGRTESHPGTDGKPFHPRQDEGEPLAASTEHQRLDDRGEIDAKFYTNDEQRITHVDAYSGQRQKTNPEIGAAPDGADVTVDGYFGTGMQRDVQESWPEPEKEVTYSHRQVKVGFGEDDPDLSAKQRKAVTGSELEKKPLVGRENLPPNSRIHLVDDKGEPYATVQTDDKGKPTHLHTNREHELDAAGQGVQVTRDSDYGGENGADVQDSWPKPKQEFTYSHDKRPEGFLDDPGSLTERQRTALTERYSADNPVSNREGYPANTRIHVVGSDGNPYTTVQTGPDGTVTHVHTFKPFDADLSNPPPNAVVRVDHGIEYTDRDGNRRVTEGDVHRTDERGNTVATTSHPTPEGASDVRRSGSDQQRVGGIGGKDAKGNNIDDGGHHGGTSQGKPGEAINQATQGSVENRRFGPRHEDYDTDQTWYSMERDRDKHHRVEQEEILEARDEGQDDPHTRFYRSIGQDERHRPQVIVRSFPNDHNTPLWDPNFRARKP